jgi:hypothetical protein
MKGNESPAPRANAGSRANSKIERDHHRPSSIDWKADAAAVRFARVIPLPPTVARASAALASLGRAFG